MTLGRTARWLATAAILVYVWLAVQVWRSQAHPETFRAWDGPSAWIVGPSGKSLLNAAEARIGKALAALNDTTLPGDRRLAEHRSELKIAEELLIRSLRAEPAQPAALARLAAVRWELDPPLDEPSVERGLALVNLAAQLAPQAPRIRLQLGELLLRAGRVDDALLHLRSSIELDPASAKPVIVALRDQGLLAAEILARLPRVPEVLLELKGPFLEDGNSVDFLDAAEPFLSRAPRALLESFGDAALAAQQGARLAATMDGLAASADPLIESERRFQLARGLLAAARRAESFAAARDARMLAPEDARLAERVGRLALEAGEPAYAREAFGAALSATARAAGSAARRALLYREIGQAEDAAGHPDRAYQAYLQALRLNPAEAWAKKRVEQLEKAAGVAR